MIRRLFIVLSLFIAAGVSQAQSATYISASSITDSFLRPATTAKLCFAPVDAMGAATGFRVGSTQVLTTPVCGVVSNGVLQTGLSVVPTPAGIYYHITAQNRTTNAVIRDYGMTQITGSAWTLDTYDANMAILPVTAITAGTVTTLPFGSGASCTITGSGVPYSLNCSIPTAAPGTVDTTARAYASGLIYNVKAYGAKGDGTTDDTTAIAAAVAAMPSSGGILYFPFGKYKVSSTITVNVPVTIRGDGSGANDLTQVVSQISCTSATTDCIKATGKYAYVNDIAIVNMVGFSGTAPTAGAGFNYSYSGSYIFPTFAMDHVLIEGFYNSVYAPMSEVGRITNSNFYDSYHDGFLLGSGTISNSGDFGFLNDVFTCAGASPNAAIDYEGALGGWIHSSMVDQGISQNNADCNYGIYIGIGGPYSIEGTHIEHAKTMPIYSPSTTGLLNNITGNQFYQENVSGPAVYIANAYSLVIDGNVFQGPSGTLPYAVQFVACGSCTMGVNTYRGYAAAQSGLDLTPGTFANHDYSKALLSTDNVILSAATVLGIGTTPDSVSTVQLLGQLNGFMSPHAMANGSMTLKLRYAGNTEASIGTGFLEHDSYGDLTLGATRNSGILGAVHFVAGGTERFALLGSGVPSGTVMHGSSATKIQGSDGTGTSGNYAKFGSDGSVSDSGVAATAVPQSVKYCGTTTTCANTAQASPRIVHGTVTLASGTATVASMTAWTATTSYDCTCTDTATTAAACTVQKTSTSSITVKGTSTDTVMYMCVGN